MSFIFTFFAVAGLLAGVASALAGLMTGAFVYFFEGDQHSYYRYVKDCNDGHCQRSKNPVHVWGHKVAWKFLGKSPDWRVIPAAGAQAFVSGFGTIVSLVPKLIAKLVLLKKWLYARN